MGNKDRKGFRRLLLLWLTWWTLLAGMSFSTHAAVLTTTKAALAKGESFYLSVDECDVQPKGYSDNKSIATVKRVSGCRFKITAKKAGTVYVRFKAGGQTLKCRVQVREKRKPVKLAVLTSHGKDGSQVRGQFSALGANTTMIYSSNIDPEQYDGLVIPGGADIDPARYGEPVNGSVGIDRSLDALQFAVMKKFVKAGKPVFGVCRGMQLINVYFGGTLKQHIPNHRGVGQETTIEEDSLMYQTYGSRLRVDSWHHQAVKKLGKGLIVTERAKDKNVEALQHETLPVYGIQWHLELTGSSYNKIFKSFLEVCRKQRDFQ